MCAAAAAPLWEVSSVSRRPGTPSVSARSAGVVITASPEIRAARRPVDDAREQRLIPDSEKVRRADYSYVNDGTLEELDAFVAEVMAQLTG